MHLSSKRKYCTADLVTCQRSHPRENLIRYKNAHNVRIMQQTSHKTHLRE